MRTGRLGGCGGVNVCLRCTRRFFPAGLLPDPASFAISNLKLTDRHSEVHAGPPCAPAWGERPREPPDQWNPIRRTGLNRFGFPAAESEAPTSRRLSRQFCDLKSQILAWLSAIAYRRFHRPQAPQTGLTRCDSLGLTAIQRSMPDRLALPGGASVPASRRTIGTQSVELV
jgi:hypothetical protein